MGASEIIGGLLALIGLGNLITLAVLGVNVVRSLTRMEMKVDTMWHTFEGQLERRSANRKPED